MKPPNSLNRFLAISYLGAILAIAFVLAWTARQDERQYPAYSTDEYNAFQAQNIEKDPHTKTKLLDDFVAQYPKSDLMPYIYMEYSQTYFSLRNFPQAVAYADKFLTFPADGDAGSRLSVLAMRAVAFANSCEDGALRTTGASLEAQDAAAVGLQLLRQLPLDGEALAVATNSNERIFNSEAAIAVSHLKGERIPCVPSSDADTFSPLGNSDRLDDIMRDLLSEQRQKSWRKESGRKRMRWTHLAF
jgi:predicted negative regulator of RcsB-dependent stress response